MSYSNEIALVDLSSIAYPLWHVSQSEPDPDAGDNLRAHRVRALTANHPHAAICCDSGRSFRKDINADYKATRPASEAPLLHQIMLARERLAEDGYPVWAVAGFEADDLIATATVRTLAHSDLTALIISADKDLLQLVGPRVRAMSAIDGTIRDEAGVIAKFGVKPEQMCEYLMLVGDASDNVKGASGIGPKKAAELLATYGNLSAVYQALTEHATQFKPAMATSLRDFSARLDQVRQLITLRTDVALPFEEIAAERVPQGVETFGQQEAPTVKTESPAQAELLPGPVIHPIAEPISNPVAEKVAPPSVNGNGHTTTGNEIAVVARAEVLPAPTEWERQLEPRSMPEAIDLAKHMYSSRLFSAFGTPQAVLATVLAGREMGMSAMASLRGFHVIDGKPVLAADLIRALVIRSGKAKYFRCTERTDERATFETQRENEPPFSLSYTVEEAKTAGMVKPGSGWTKNPADMCVARASSKLARLVYPDVTHGLYAPEEMV